MAKKQHVPSHVAALERAIRAVGGQAALAAGITRFPGAPRLTQQAVSKWVKKGIPVAAEYWPAIEHISDAAGDRVDRRDLRPDVFGATAA